MKLKNHILIVGGDTILNLIIATIYTRAGHDVAVINENKNNAFHYSNLFLGNDGGEKLAKLGIIYDSQTFDSEEDLLNRLCASIINTDKGSLSFFGSDYRVVHRAKFRRQLTFHMTPKQKSKPNKCEAAVYKVFPPIYGNWRRYLPRILKRVKVNSPQKVILTTPPAFIRGIKVWRENGVRKHSIETEVFYLCECAKTQIENFEDKDLFEKSFALYISDIEELKKAANKAT